VEREPDDGSSNCLTEEIMPLIILGRTNQVTKRRKKMNPVEQLTVTSTYMEVRPWTFI
jgi:hypothetical protein